MTIGDSVLDGYKQTSSWLDNGTDWLGDLCEFYRERAAIERESAQKLASLTSKFFNKKANVSSSVSVGNHPLTTPGSLENHSMHTWKEILSQTEHIAEERRKLADEFNKQISEEFALVRTKFEDLNKYFKNFSEDMTNHRDKTYQQLKKTKSTYDSSCETMESSRAKSKKNSEAKETEMYKCKNSYIIQLNVSNRIKDKYYHDDVPQLLDTMQHAYEAKVSQTNRLLQMAISFEKRRLRHSTESLDLAKSHVEANVPELDTQMFIEHNANGFRWTDPADFLFEPSPIWHDNDLIYVQSDEIIKILRALLTEAYGRSDTATTKSKTAFDLFSDATNAVLTAKFYELTPNQTMPFLKSEVNSLHKLVNAENSRLETEVEIEAIEAATAAVDMSHVPQTKLKQHRTLFGKKKEVVEVVDGTKLKPHQSGKSLGLSSLLARATLSKRDSSAVLTAYALYNFSASGPGELSFQVGEQLPVLEEDDGSGWIKVSQNGEEGLVPATYVDVRMSDSHNHQDNHQDNHQGTQGTQATSRPVPPPSRGTKGHQMVALYEYIAADSSQLSIYPQSIINVVEADTGTGWTLGTLNGETGIFPTSYAQNIS